MSVITTLVLILMFITPTVSVTAVMLQSSANKTQTGSQRSVLTNGVIVLFSIGIHLLGARGLLVNYLNLSGSSSFVVLSITTIVTLLLGWAVGQVVLDLRK
ncbi:hypothetical protein [Candidatus Leptofilum sp.]|uniref:hypothetical protein n=1 Tax=Candidatus Leptofilum sp. TaxID=3241576 RepID=UPI003B5B91B5